MAKKILHQINPAVVVWTLIIGYFAIFSIVAVLRHYNFWTQAWDMGIFDQLFWNAINGRGLTGTVEPVSHHLGVHMSPFLYLLVPLYAIFKSPYLLLIVQTLALALGAWPLYLLGQRILKNNAWALAVSLGYLIYPSLHWLNVFDFHTIAFFMPLMLSALYFITTYHWVWATIFLMLAASTKENAIIAVLFVGVYLLTERMSHIKDFKFSKSQKYGLIISIAALVYFFLSVKLIMPAFGGGLIRFDFYDHLGQTPWLALQNIIQNPSLLFGTLWQAKKLVYLLNIFLPVLLLPLFSGRAFVLLLPGLAQNLLSSNPKLFSGLLHYDAILIPFIWFTVLIALSRLSGPEFSNHGLIQPIKTYLKNLSNLLNITNFNKFQPATMVGSIAILCLTMAGTYMFLVRSPLSPSNLPLEWLDSGQRRQEIETAVKQIPQGVSVATSGYLFPHLSQRRYVFITSRENWLVDYVLLEHTNKPGLIKSTPAQIQKYVISYMQDSAYQSQIFFNKYQLIHK